MSDTKTLPPPATVVSRPALWTVMPGWGISADLIPPELVKARQIAVLRRWLAVGIVALVLVCGGGYYLALRESDAATADLAVIADRTLELQAVGRSYSDVVSIQNRIAQIRGQVTQVMAPDVDLVALTGALQTSLPATMTISQQAITISMAGAATATGLDASGATRIGTVTMSGTGQTLDDLSDYVDSLAAIPGVVDVLPLANSLNSEGAVGTQFSLTLGLTDALLSHRFDAGG
ncbi:MAG: hypothetical protein ABIR83_02245 [Nakamurella sp.]